MYSTVLHHTPLGRFSRLGISAVGIVSVPERSALETSRRELSQDVSFGSGTPLAVEQSSLEKTPQGCVRYTVVCGTCIGSIKARNGCVASSLRRRRKASSGPFGCQGRVFAQWCRRIAPASMDTMADSPHPLLTSYNIPRAFREISQAVGVRVGQG